MPLQGLLLIQTEGRETFEGDDIVRLRIKLFIILHEQMDLGYGMLYHLIQKSLRHLTTSKEKFKAMNWIAVVDCADFISVI